MTNLLRARSWSPYACGVALGVLVAISVGVFGHRLSGAGAYQQLSASLGAWLQPRSPYFGHIVRGGVGWDVLVSIGGLWGSFAASNASGTFRLRTMPDALWTDAFGASVRRRWGLAFLGATLTSIGAGIAGGCTASLAVSGGAMLSPAAFLFMLGMFAGGIPTAFWTLQKKR
ncbi:MAG: YeeE/YedE thiosulfate transporter family protein [Polyangiales bacterium]